MTQDPFRRDPYGFARMRVMRLNKWQLVLISALALAAVLTLVVVAAGAFLVLFPIVLFVGLIAGMLSRWRGSKPARAPQNSGARANRPTEQIIDAEYVILSDKSRDEKP
jgi:uncharacterized membrane protein